MFDWISDLISGIGNAISSALSGVWETVSGSIWGVFMNWLYTSVYNALADFFTMMTELGANLFDLSWVQAALNSSLCSAGDFLLQGWRLPSSISLSNINPWDASTSSGRFSRFYTGFLP